MRQRTAVDSATPAGIGVLAEVFARLWHLTGEAAWRERAQALLRAFAGKPEQFAAMPTLLAAADLLEEAATVVIAGDPAHPRAQALAAAALAAADPAVVVLRAPSPDSLPADHPAFGKSAGKRGRRSLCLPPQCVRDADGGWQGPGSSIVGARIVSEPSIDVPVAASCSPQRIHL